MASLSFLGYIEPDGNPVNPSDLDIRILWFAQRQAYYDFLNVPTRETLRKLFGVLGRKNNIDSLRVDFTSPVPVAGDMFSRTSFGKNVSIGAETLLLAHAGISLGDNAVLGQKVKLITLGHPVHPSQRHLHKIGPISIERNVLVGAGTVVINGGRAEPVTVGEGSIILPDSILTKNIPEYSVVNGTNNVVLQGKEYFLPLDSAKAHEHTSLESRLTPEGLKTLAGLGDKNARADLTRSSDITFAPGTRVYMETRLNPTDAKHKFFDSTEPKIVDSCLIPGPVYGVGTMPTLCTSMTVNQGSRLEMDSEGSGMTFSEKVLLAPYVTLKALRGGKIKFAMDAWCGVGTFITAEDGGSVEVGEGTIIASGTRIKVGKGQIVKIPEWSIITNKGDGWAARGIDKEKAILPLPKEWVDKAAYYKAFADNSATARGMTQEKRLAYVEKLWDSLPKTPNGILPQQLRLRAP